MAVALYNKDVANQIEPPFGPTSGCAADSWVGGEGAGGYYEACAGDGGDGNVGTFSNLTLAQAQSQCCANAQCAGFSWGADKASPVVTGSGYFKGNANCGFTKSKVYTGYTRSSAIPVAPVSVLRMVRTRDMAASGCEPNIRRPQSANQADVFEATSLRHSLQKTAPTSRSSLPTSTSSAGDEHA